MKTENKWEEYFESWLDTTEFTLIKHKDGWGLYDRQGGNLGDIESDRFESAADIFDRMEAYIIDYIFEDLENELDAYEIDTKGLEIPWSVAEWLCLRHELYSENSEFFNQHAWEFGVLETIEYHANEINLENIYYEEE